MPRTMTVRAALAAAALVAAPVGAYAYSGEDLISGLPFHHFDITLRALAGDAAGGVQNGDFQSIGFSSSAAYAVAWHADYIDSYLYSPIWWAQGVVGDNPTQRIKASFSQYPHLINLHFDDTFSPAGIDDTWQRYASGALAGLEWAAQRGDVPAAYNILGVSVHAVQDFYSHSNWIDDAGRRSGTYLETARTSRMSAPIYTGSYELPRISSQKSHGKISFACSIYGRPELKSVLDQVCTGFSPFAETPYCITQRQCTSSATTTISVEGADIASALVLDPPGIALDSSWLARADGPVRGLTNTSGAFLDGKDSGMLSAEQCTRAANFGTNCSSQEGTCTNARPRSCVSDSDRLFGTAKFFAIEATQQWVNKIDEIMTQRHPAYWARVKAGGADASLAKRIEQYENFAQVPFQFLSAGPYPVGNGAAAGRTFERTSDGYYLRLDLNTANVTNAGTDADIQAIVDYAGGKSAPITLDYMPTNDASAGIRSNRLLVYNDFEAGDRTVYTVGPFPAPPQGLTLVNEAADSGEVLDALADDIVSSLEDVVEGLESSALGIISGNADFVGSKTIELTYADLVRGGPGSIIIDAAKDGKYELKYTVTSSTTSIDPARRAQGWRTFDLKLVELKCHKESEWDRGSASDEPFFFLALSALNGDANATGYAGEGPYSDMDTGESKAIGYSLEFPLQTNGVAVLAMQLFESDDESLTARQKLYEEFKTGIEGGADPANKKFLDALGAALAADWEVGSVSAYGFRRGAQTEAGPVLTNAPGGVIAGGASKRFALSPGGMNVVIPAGPQSPTNWVVPSIVSVTAAPAAQPPAVAPPTVTPPTVTPPALTTPPAATRPAPAQPAPPPVARSFTTEGVTGRNLARAEYDGGYFEQTTASVWTEYNANGPTGATFAEQGRDDWSVYVHDASRDISLQFDVYRKMIRLAQRGGPMTDQWAMTAAKRVAAPGEANAACYWLDGGGWKKSPAPMSKAQCFEMDSCDGGAGRSGGGCYKWADGADAPRQPW